MKLYKYRSLDKDCRTNTEAILNDSTLYFATPDKFNDPFEFQVAISTAGTRAEIEKYFELCGFDSMKMLKEFDERAFHEYVGTLLENKDGLGWPNIFSKLKAKYGVLCLSSSPLNINLWSNYADSHRGICFEFESASKDDFFHHAVEVTYLDNPPKVEIIKEYIDEAKRKKIAGQFAYTKANIHWDHEKEFRILCNQSGPDVFPKECLKAVYFGCNFDLKDPFVNLLQELRPDIEVILLAKAHNSYSFTEKFRCKPGQIIKQ